MAFLQTYEAVMAAIVDRAPGADKFAHSYVGLAIWLGAAMVLRRPLRSAVPLAVVVVAECINEGIDRLTYGSWRWHDTLGDALASWFWPLVLMLALRRCPGLRR